MEKLKQTWDNLTPKNKQMAVLGGGVLLFFILAFVVDATSGNEAPQQTQTQAPAPVDRGFLLDPEGRQLTISEIQNQVRQLQERNADLLEFFEEQDQKNQERFDAVTNQLEESLQSSQREIEQLRQENQLLIQQSTEQAVAFEQRLSEVSQQTSQRTPVAGETGGQSTPLGFDSEPTEQDAQTLFRANNGVAPNNGVVQPNTPASQQSGTNTATAAAGEGALRIIDVQAEETEEEALAEEEQANNTFYLQTGAMLRGVLITGMDAPTSVGSRGDPTISLVRIQHEAILPNYWSMDIRECFATIEGYGDLASERAQLRGRTLSCVSDSGLVLEANLPAYAVGEDGKSGVRGRLVSKQGQLIGKAMAASFIEGISSVFQPQQSSITSLSDLTGGNLSNAAEGAALGSAGEALSTVADFYIEMAEQIYPVIEVDAGRSVQLILSAGTTLNFTEKNMTTQPLVN